LLGPILFGLQATQLVDVNAFSNNIGLLYTRAIVTAWQQLSQAFLDRSIGEWRRRLENVVQCNGGHIEHVC